MGIHDGHREKMRRRFLETGLEGFADHEALELLLYYAIPRRDTNPIAHALMERYDSLSGVLNAPVEDLEKVEGIGESAAILLSLVSRLSRKARIADASQETILNSSERAGAYLLERFAGERRELVFLLCLDRKGRLLACKRLAEGDVASADLNIRQRRGRHPPGGGGPADHRRPPGGPYRGGGPGLRLHGGQRRPAGVKREQAPPLEPPPPVCGLANAPKALGSGYFATYTPRRK